MKADPSPNATATLRGLGFSELEAMVYCELLRSPGSTGYAIAKVIKRPHANVYQALNSLELKGAVLAEQSVKKTYAAVPSDELIAHLRARFDQGCALAERALRDLEIGSPSSDAFYKLATKDQLFAKARGLLAESEEMVVFYGYPSVAALLREDLKAASARGIKLAGLVFRKEDEIPGTELQTTHVAEFIRNRWTYDIMILVVDGRHALLAMLQPDSGELLRALWMKSGFVSSFFHNALVSDIILHKHDLVKTIKSPNTHLFGGYSPALRELLGMPTDE